jgi:hypothetical protein
MMSEGDGRRALAVSARRYRWLDRGTKLTGVALIAGGLEVGGSTPTGIVLAMLGVAIGVSTVIIDKQ